MLFDYLSDDFKKIGIFDEFAIYVRGIMPLTSLDYPSSSS